MTDWNMYTGDCFGLSYRQLDPLGRATTFTYDAAGRQTSILDARGVENTFQYDAVNRFTRRMSTHDPPVTFGYDPSGNRIEAVDGTGRSTFTYDLLNRRSGAVDPAGHGIRYTYGAIGQRPAMIAPGGCRFTYAYDPRGQISHLINPQGDRTTFSYDSAARRTLSELANGTRASYTYDAASRVQQLYNLTADGSVILGLTYDHDPVGNPTSMLESTGDRVTWTYDATDRLTREQRSGESAYTNEPRQYGNLISQYCKGPALWLPSYYHYDALGSARALTDGSAQTTNTYLYDGALGTFYIRARIYEPATGRWMSQDPLLFPSVSKSRNDIRFPKAPSHIRLRSQTSGNREDEVNLYLACCVPNGTDPSGLECHPEDHHWLAQQFGPRIEALCKPHFPTFSIHLYTTTLQRCSGRSRAYPSASSGTYSETSPDRRAHLSTRCRLDLACRVRRNPSVRYPDRSFRGGRSFKRRVDSMSLCSEAGYSLTPISRVF
jgi:YD repeat-containing protein